MKFLEMETAISNENDEGEVLIKVVTKAIPVNISVTSYLNGEASPAAIAEVVITNSETIRQVANILCAKQ